MASRRSGNFGKLEKDFGGELANFLNIAETELLKVGVATWKLGKLGNLA